MAIKISNTTVVNNSRQLQNIASIDTTTKNAISNAGVGGLGHPNFYGASFFRIRNAAGTTTIHAQPTNVSFTSNYTTITGSGNGTFCRFYMGALSASYTRNVLGLLSGSGYIAKNATIVTNTTEFNFGSGDYTTYFDGFITSGQTLRMRFALFNAVDVLGYKVDV